MKKVTITICVLATALISQGQVIKKQIRKMTTDSISNRIQFHQGNFQIGAGATNTNFYANSFFLGSTFQYHPNTGVSLSARYFITDHLAAKVTTVSHGQKSGRITQIRNGDAENYVGVYADCVLKGNDFFFGVEHFVASRSRAKANFGLTGFLSSREAFTNIHEQKYTPAPWKSYEWTNTDDTRKATLLGMGATCGVSVPFLKKLALDVNCGLFVANIHNQTPSSSQNIYTAKSYDGSNLANVTMRGIDKKNILTIGTQAGAHLYYNF